MSTTTRLGITHLEEAQAKKETAINEALDTIDAEAALLDGDNAFTGDNGWYGATPVGAASVGQDLFARMIALGFLVAGTMPVNTNGGALTAGVTALSGTLGGSGSTAFSLKRTALTFPSDGNHTLTSGQADSILIDVQAGVITATRDIILPGTGGAFYAVINRNAQAVRMKTSGGTGITIAATRAALICLPSGVNCFRLTPDVDYTL